MSTNIHVLIDLCWLATAVAWILTASAFHPVTHVLPVRSREPQVVLLGTGALLMFSNVFLGGVLDRPVIPQGTLSQTGGLLLAAGGNAIAIGARLYLGRNWSHSAVIRDGHELIRTGPYALVRHPIYAGMTLALLGTTLVYGEIRHLLALPVLLTALQLKQRSEEALLDLAFGPQYADYRRAVRWSIIPFVL